MQRSTAKQKRRGGPAGAGLASRLIAPNSLLAGFLVLVFAIGGASRADVFSLQFLRPVAIMIAAVGLITLHRHEVVRYRWPFGLMLATVALVGFYLIPLPPSWWQALPGRDLIAEIDKFAGLGDIWRPISIDPPDTWNALWSLSVPMAALILAAQIDTNQQRKIMAVVMILGVASGLLAIIQVLGAPNGLAYFYRITNNGSAVGLFANRNHQAVFLTTLLPILAAWMATRENNDKQASNINISALIIAGFVLAPLILVTGSRAGLATLLLALPLAIWSGGGLALLPSSRNNTVKAKRKSKKGSNGLTWALLSAGALLIIATLWLTITLGQGTAIERLSIGAGYAEDMRGKMAPILLELFQFFLPLGSGAGTFAATYKMFEPDALLLPNYANHAHNDFLELAVTCGLPGLALLATSVIAVLWRLRIIWPKPSSWPVGSRSHLIARAGFSILVLLAIASIVDYPLRVPSVQAVAIIALVWLFRAKRGSYERAF